MLRELAIAAAVAVLVLEAVYLLFLSANAFLADLSHPGFTNYGADIFVTALAVGAVPIIIGILRRRRLGWYVFVPYEIFAVAFMSAQILNG
jgi:hypothetical protein